MITRAIRVKFVLFIVIALTAVSVVAVRYADVGGLLGLGDYQVTVAMDHGGGIFPNAEVTYRGVPVGKVESLRLTDDGMEMRLRMDSDGPKVPASSTATVADRSAIGEQYVNLVAQNDKPPYLHDGSRISEDKTATPVSPQTLLTSLDGLVKDVPTGSLRTVVDETDKAFSGSGQNLRTLMTASNSFLHTANQYVPQSRQLLSSGGTVLATQEQMGNNLSQFSSGLRKITGQLRSSDPDLRRIINTAPQVGQQVSDLLANSGPGLSTLIANLLTTSKLTDSRLPGIRQVLVGLPIIGGISPTLSRNNRGQMSFVMTFFQPPPCTKGYEKTVQHPGTATGDYEPNTAAYCAEPSGSPILVRGAQHAPYPGPPPQPAKPDYAAARQAHEQLPGVLGDVGPNSGPSSVAQLYGLGS